MNYKYDFSTRQRDAIDMLQRFNTGRPKHKKEIGINDIEIVGKVIDKCRSIEQLREAIIEKIEIYKTLLSLLDRKYEKQEGNAEFNSYIESVKRLK